MEPLDGQYGEVSSISQVRSDDARREAKGRSVARPKNEEGGKAGDRILPDRTLKVWSPDLFSVDSALAYHTAKIMNTAKQQGTSCCPEELTTEVEMQIETKEVRKTRERQMLMFALSKDSEVEEVDVPTPRRRQNKGTEADAKASSTRYPREASRELARKMRRRKASCSTSANRVEAEEAEVPRGG